MNYQPAKNQNFLNSFATSNNVGKTAESMFLDFMAKAYPNVRVEDVSLNPDYQWNDIDFVLHHPTGRTSTVEVKGDTYSTTGNFAIETIANKEHDRKGWLYTSKADTLCYVFVNGLGGADNMFMVKFDKLRTLVFQNPNLREKTAKAEQQLRSATPKTTIVKLVPVTLMKTIATATYNVGIKPTFNSHSAGADWNR